MRTGLVLVALVAACGMSTLALPNVVAPSFTTLGTNAGPIPNAARAEPANLLRVGDQNILIDVGDGASWQLAKAGVPLRSVKTVILSHLHFDHSGGLFAFLSQRYQSVSPGEVTIYGPPGTKALVDALVGAMVAAATGPPAARQRLIGGPGDNVKVIELTDGEKFVIGGTAITAAANSHYSFASGSAEAARYVSLSFRFDLPGRSIVYTGDTGPSANVEKLARGADLLIAEIIDPEATLAQFKRDQPGVPDAVMDYIAEHFRKEHLSPREVGLLASRAGVKSLVLTHIAIEPGGISAAKIAIAANYKGPVTFAEDLTQF